MERLLSINKELFYRNSGMNPDPCVKAVRDFFTGPTFPSSLGDKVTVGA